MNAGPAWISYRRRDQLYIDVIWDMLSNIMQSNADIFTDCNFEVILTQVSVPVGTGRVKLHGLEFAE